YCVAQNYMTADDGRFLPNKEVTRGQAAQMLYSLADRPAVSGQAPFTDISAGDYYSDAVTWCVQQDIAAGFADRTFRPDIPISRQQFIALLHRYTKFRGYRIEPSDNLNKFPDGGTVSDYAVIPMGWATHYSLIAGISGNLEPFGTLSRSQMACILQTYDKQIAGK
ncbi:MAG: S-layer homology domain-containing protein, partial [Oscillospiraceae bacterium]|nr:S-layer homology domain-containing protein [Oscillospiraceae bacterium]